MLNHIEKLEYLYSILCDIKCK